ncbi:MAG: TIGR03016 family PEP-CTERM system-associated outer membrane protein [Gammaproteobacteria bacterium]|nr:TIGR03016 family PEP-CTERM system-associated outer membrane protein [Gammaproteobacteria bacterium]
MKSFHALFLLLVAPVVVAEWEITPSIEIKETYSDNIRLSTSGNEQDDFITEVNPAIKIKGESRRLKMDLSYKIQNIFYNENSASDDDKHDLKANGTAELVDDFVFIDAKASVSQQNTTYLGAGSQDNLSIDSDRQTTQRYTVSPYIKHNFRDYLDGELRYTNSTTEYDNSISNSETNAVKLDMKSGNRFKKLKWKFNYNNSETDRETTSTIEYEQTNAEASYAFHNEFDAVVRAGDENNDLGTGVTKTPNGTYWSAGLNWHPSYHFNLQLTGGDKEKYSALTIKPTKRTAFSTSYRDADVGVNNGGQWMGAFSHTSKRSTWRVTYRENTTTSQTEILDLYTFASDFQQATYADTNIPPDLAALLGIDPDDIFPGVYINPETGVYGSIPDLLAGGNFPLSNEVYKQQALNANVTYKTAKSDFSFGLSTSDRDLLVSQTSDSSGGWNAGWLWRYSNRVRSNLTASWRTIEYSTVTREDEYWNIGWDVSRTLARDTKGSIGIRRAERTSDVAGNDYEENRIYLLFNMKF